MGKLVLEITKFCLMEDKSRDKGIEEIEYRPSKQNNSQFEDRKMIEGRRVDLETGQKKSDWDDGDLLCSPGFCTMRMKCLIGSGTSVFFAVVVVILLACSVHKIREGTVGIYFRSGALQEKVTYPGIHLAMPFITDIERIQIRPRTDTMDPISTVTKDGIRNTFHNVQVISDVNPASLVQLVKKFGLEFHKTLVFDRVYEELRIFCANHTVDEVYNTMFLDIVDTVTRGVKESINNLGDELGEGGIKIYHLTIPKPQIPPDIAKNYKEVKVQWTKQLVATQQQKTEKIQKDTDSKRFCRLTYKKTSCKKKENRNFRLWKTKFLKIALKPKQMLSFTQRRSKRRQIKIYIPKNIFNSKWLNLCQITPNFSFLEKTVPWA